MTTGHGDSAGRGAEFDPYRAAVDALADPLNDPLPDQLPTAPGPAPGPAPGTGPGSAPGSGSATEAAAPPVRQAASQAPAAPQAPPREAASEGRRPEGPEAPAGPREGPGAGATAVWQSPAGPVGHQDPAAPVRQEGPVGSARQEGPVGPVRQEVPIGPVGQQSPTGSVRQEVPETPAGPLGQAEPPGAVRQVRQDAATGSVRHTEPPPAVRQEMPPGPVRPEAAPGRVGHAAAPYESAPGVQKRPAGYAAPAPSQGRTGHSHGAGPAHPAGQPPEDDATMPLGVTEPLPGPRTQRPPGPSRLEARRAARALRPGPGIIASRVIGELFITCGVLMLLFVAYQLWWTNIRADQQAGGATDALHEKWEHKPDTVDPERKAGAFEPGEGFAVIHIPKIGITAPIAQGVSKTAVLDKGMVGHYDKAPLKTAMPWDKKGNFALAGHRNTHGEPFRYINRLEPGDFVVVETQSKFYTYEVTRQLPSTLPSDTGVIDPVPPKSGFTKPGRYVTLTTCTPEFTSKYRLIVWGKMVDERPRSKGKPDALVE
ncbi:hypothetical protein TPA0909_47400 [Streptomyces albus]|nr:class E sortase [Streptomyces albus]GHJ23126.1 hypothetical protein TPA0909_47400 [Streptomyces albus]